MPHGGEQSFLWTIFIACTNTKCRVKGTLPADPCYENLQSSSWNPKQLCTLQVQPRGVVKTSSRDSCFLVLPFHGKNKSEELQQVTCNVKSAHYTASSTTVILYALLYKTFFAIMQQLSADRLTSSKECKCISVDLSRYFHLKGKERSSHSISSYIELHTILRGMSWILLTI